MPGVRNYIMGFLYRTMICVCLFLLMYIIGELWPAALHALKAKLLYTVNYGQLARDLKDLARCVLPR